MRLTKVDAETNKRKILEVASRLFRAKGAHGVALSDVMKEAGFTHGGFYNHFRSKEALLSAAISHSFASFLQNLSGRIGASGDASKTFLKALEGYLSPGHRDDPDGGCPTAALSIDAARAGPDAQEAFSRGIEGYLALFDTHIEGAEQPDGPKGAALLSGLVGAVVLSRAVRDVNPELSLKLLADMHDHLHLLCRYQFGGKSD